MENGKPRFFRRIAMGVFDQEYLRRQTDDLASFLADAARAYGFDPVRLYALGYSNGANIAASLMLRKPASLAGGVLLRPMLPFEPEATPDLSGKAVLLSAGRDDTMVSPESTERLAEVLRGGGADVTLAWQRSGHNLTQRGDRAGRAVVRAAWQPRLIDCFRSCGGCPVVAVVWQFKPRR